jgi:hypothetical protein
MKNEKKPKRRYRRFILGVYFYCYAPSQDAANRSLIRQAKTKIGRYNLDNCLEVEDLEKPNVYNKLTTTVKERFVSSLYN